MVTDKHGNVYVYAQSWGKIHIDGQTAAHDSSGTHSLSSWDCHGNLRWMKAIGRRQGASTGSFSIRHIAIDTADGFYITGFVSHLIASDSTYLDADTAFKGKF